MRPGIRAELQPIIDQLLAEGIIKKAEKQGPFLSNSHGVAKPQKNVSIAGKTDMYLRKQAGMPVNHSRLTLDMRALNRHVIQKPKMNLPSHTDLVDRFSNHYVSCADLSNFYWAINMDHSAQHLTNCWFGRQVYSFCRLPMGYVASSYIAQSASELTYGQTTMLKFLKHKNWKMGSTEWPFEKVDQFLIIYLDDLCVTTSKALPNAMQVHLHVIEYLLFSTKLYGLKLGKSKFQPWVVKFKFLGHYFNVEKSTNSIPPDRLKAFKEFRAPASCAEALSRLGVLGYYRRYIPLLQILSVPIAQMAQSGIFRWTSVHQEAWKAILLVASMGFELSVINKQKPIYFTSDASQISIAYLIFQVDDGQIKIIGMDCKILKGPERNRPAAHRETLALLFTLMSNEAIIRSHNSKVLVMTDCISLGYIFRLKDSSSKLLEGSLYVYLDI